MVLSVLSFLWSLSFIHSVAKWRSTKNWSHSPKRFSLILNFPFNFIRPKSDCRNGILITYSHCLPDFNRVLRDSWNETFYDSQIYLRKEGESHSSIMNFINWIFHCFNLSSTRKYFYYLALTLWTCSFGWFDGAPPSYARNLWLKFIGAGKARGGKMVCCGKRFESPSFRILKLNKEKRKTITHIQPTI